MARKTNPVRESAGMSDGMTSHSLSGEKAKAAEGRPASKDTTVPVETMQ